MTNLAGTCNIIQRALNFVIGKFDSAFITVRHMAIGARDTALCVNAGGAKAVGKEIRLDTGDVVRSGVLMDPRGRRRNVDSPQQLFTRWYGFALTFPGCDVFGG